MNEHKSKETQVFNAALALSTPAERAACLDHVCAGGPALREKLGEGGGGVVYVAEQEQEEPVRRRVALKVIKLGRKEEAGADERELKAGVPKSN